MQAHSNQSESQEASMTGEESHSSQAYTEEQVGFNIGISKKENNKMKTAEEVAEQRRQEMFSGTNAESSKR